VTPTPDHVLRNRVSWDRLAADYAGPALRGWAAAEPAWGTWRVPEEQLGVLPPDLDGTASIELGCGTGYVPAWLARRGARPAGLDNPAAQLATARRCKTSSGCVSRSCTPMPSRYPAPMPASIWRSPNAAPAGQPRMGAAMTLRGSLEGPQATLTPGPAPDENYRETPWSDAAERTLTCRVGGCGLAKASSGRSAGG